MCSEYIEELLNCVVFLTKKRKKGTNSGKVKTDVKTITL
jgi:hypothetical protein